MADNTEKNLHLSLTLPESSLVLEALIECPFKSVFELIGKLNHQAQQFYRSDAAANEKKLFVLAPDEISYCVNALGNLPFTRVNLLLNNIQRQLQTQHQVSSMEKMNDGV